MQQQQHKKQLTELLKKIEFQPCEPADGSAGKTRKSQSFDKRCLRQHRRRNQDE